MEGHLEVKAVFFVSHNLLKMSRNRMFTSATKEKQPSLRAADRTARPRCGSALRPGAVGKP